MQFAAVKNAQMKILKRIVGRSTRYKRLFDSPDGEFVMGHLVREFHYYDMSYVPGSHDQTAFNEGTKRVISFMINLSTMSNAKIQEIADMAAKAEKSDIGEEEEY